MKRIFQRGDIVAVAPNAVDALKYVPGFPQKINDTTGRITSTWRTQHTDDGIVTIQLSACPEISNLQFKVEEIALIVPVEVDRRLSAIEKSLNLTTDK